MASTRSSSKMRGLLMIVAALLATNLFLEFQPHTLPWFAWFRSASAASAVTSQDPLTRIEEFERDLADFYERSKLAEPPAARRVKRLLADLLLANETLQREDTETEAARLARLATLRAHFVAAEALPTEFSDSFVDAARLVAANAPQSVDSAQADALLLVHTLPVDVPLASDWMDRLVDYGKTYQGSPLTTALFCEVADKLWRNDQQASSQQVLERGLQEFAGQPHIGQIVNRLADRGQLAPPEPVLTKAVWEAMRRGEGTAPPPASGPSGDDR